MHRAEAVEWLQLIKEASLRVILKTSCCGCVFSPGFCKSISEWQGFSTPALAGAGLSRLLLVNLDHVGKTHKAKSYTE